MAAINVRDLGAEHAFGARITGGRVDPDTMPGVIGLGHFENNRKGDALLEMTV